MNNSVGRLIDGIVATLRKEIVPHIDEDFARGQAFGIIYMLNSLKLRASWSTDFLGEQLRALSDLSCELEPLKHAMRGAPMPSLGAPPVVSSAAALEEARNAGDAQICELIDWLAASGQKVGQETRAKAETAIDRYLNRQARYELTTSAKPMFVEMSGGVDKS